MQLRSACFSAGLPTALPSLGLRSVTLFVKGEVGSTHLDRPPGDFHGACHLGNPGDQVSGLPSSRVPSRCSGLLQPAVCPPPLLLCAGGRGVPAGKGPQPFSVLLPKHWLGTKVGRPSWTPF